MILCKVRLYALYSMDYRAGLKNKEIFNNFKKVTGKCLTPWKLIREISGILHSFMFIRLCVINFDTNKSWTQTIFIKTINRLDLKCSQSKKNSLQLAKYGSGQVGVLLILPRDSSPKDCVTILEHRLLLSLIMCLDGKQLSGIREVKSSASSL